MLQQKPDLIWDLNLFVKSEIWQISLIILLQTNTQWHLYSVKEGEKGSTWGIHALCLWYV